MNYELFNVGFKSSDMYYPFDLNRLNYCIEETRMSKVIKTFNIINYVPKIQQIAEGKDHS